MTFNISVLSSQNVSITWIKSYVNYMTFLFFNIIAFSCTVHFSYMHLICAQCICMRVYMYMYVNTWVCVRMYVYNNIHMCVCICVCVYICICLYVYIYIYIYIHSSKYIMINSLNIVIQRDNYRSTTWTVKLITII